MLGISPMHPKGLFAPQTPWTTGEQIPCVCSSLSQSPGVFASSQSAAENMEKKDPFLRIPAVHILWFNNKTYA